MFIHDNKLAKKDTASQLDLLGKSVKIKKVYHSIKENCYYLFESMNNEYIVNAAVFFLTGDGSSNSVVEIELP